MISIASMVIEAFENVTLESYTSRNVVYRCLTTLLLLDLIEDCGD